MADDAEALRVIVAAAGSVSSPGAFQKVYKEECQFSFDTPESPGGLYVNLSTFQGFGEKFVELDHARTGQAVYLLLRWTRVPRPAPDAAAAAAAAAAPTKLAIGVAGGFQVDDPSAAFELVKEHALVALPSRAMLRYPAPGLPPHLAAAVDAVLAHADAAAAEAVSAWEEARRVSRYAATLPQEDATGRRVPPDPSAWRCADTGVTENLWLNLSDGFIGSGRRNWDGTGGNGSALAHYEAQRARGKHYPLAVKLGTITPRGADVYSYAADEDDMVEDPLLAAHLAHWGIDVMRCEKTEKSMAELEIDLNRAFEFDRILESGAALVPLRGPGYVGLANLGNSCYMNSLLQVLKEVPELFGAAAEAAAGGELFVGAPGVPADDMRVQFAKLAAGLLGPRYADVAAGDDGAPPRGIRPAMFRALAGRGHAEFSSARQQDVVEYFQHLLGKLDAAGVPAGAAGGAPSGLFTFGIEHRVACAATGRVAYNREEGTVLNLLIPEEQALNVGDVARYKEREAKRQKLRAAGAAAYIAAEGGEAAAAEAAEAPVRPCVPFDACLARFAAAEPVEAYAFGGGASGLVHRTARFASFPPYLAIAMARFRQEADWTFKKSDVLVEAPETLSLEALRAPGGLQPGETPLPAAEAAPAAGGAAAAAAAPPAPLAPDEGIVAALVGMGFSENGSRRATVATRNGGMEASMDWVLAHMEDADFNDPLPPPEVAAPAPPGAAAPAAAPEADAGKAAELMGMGFSVEAATAALLTCQGSLERAADWLFTRDDVEAAVAEVHAKRAAESAAAASAAAASAGGAVAAKAAAPLLDGKGEYTLVGFVSHMGANTACGHYVAHVRRRDAAGASGGAAWALFNDEKVAASEAPPRDCGYLYLYRRNDA